MVINLVADTPRSPAGCNEGRRRCVIAPCVGMSFAFCRGFKMTNRLLAAAIVAVIAGAAHAQTAQPDSDQKKKDTQQLDAVIVTGSLIPQAQIETASPVITITSQDLERQAFRNVYDALRTLPIATGAVQDAQATGGFTQTANTVSLFGLDPGFTLVLINGHPLTNYPLPYNGVDSNFADLATIPTTLVDHIDVLSGGQSSLYGSSAIAGVINIVLKQKLDGTDVSFRAGGFSQGGGANERLSIATGHSWGDLNGVFSLQIDKENPIFFYQRDISRSLSQGEDASRDFLRASELLLDPNYYDPGAAACSSNLFHGTEGYHFRLNHGNYCGSLTSIAYATMANQNFAVTGSANLTYKLNDSAQLYAEILYGFSKPKSEPGSAVWMYYNPVLANSASNAANFFYNVASGDVEAWQRFFAPEEMGGTMANADTNYTRQYNATAGIRGNFGQSNWGYDAYYSRSSVQVQSKQLWPLNGPFINYYLGPQQGIDPYGFGFAGYDPNEQRLLTPLTPAQFRSFSDYVRSDSTSWQQNLTMTVTNTDLLQLPAGAIGVAAVAQVGNQHIDNPVDPRVVAGDFTGLTGTASGGSRDNYAFGGEMRIPVFSMLTADVSARYDDYRSDSTRDDSKITYKAGLELRPIDTLLLRATYATAFRTPDTVSLYSHDTGFYDPSETDYYGCRTQEPNVPITQCTQTGQVIFGRFAGNPNLQNVNSTSFGYGLVWSPTAHMNVHVDYQHIKIKDEIQSQSIDQLLQLEANCRIGVSVGGQAYDINSPQCKDALQRVQRFPDDFPFALAAGTIQQVFISPINIASENLDGLQTSFDYRFEAGKYGDFQFEASYYDELKHQTRTNPGDPEIDLLHNYNSYEFKTNFSGSITWTIGNWSTTLFGRRNGHAVNTFGNGITGPYTTYNGSVRYAFDSDAYIQLSANNLFDKDPPFDASNGWPYYNVQNYNALGREIFIEMGVHFK
jgi:outer membrane receptor protein involved in Fe transport